jgi:hypothetical protein
MKFLFLIILFLLSLNSFGAGNVTSQPVSTQKVANTSLTCPTGKWCRVIISYSQFLSSTTNGAVGSASSVPANGSFEVILKSGDALASTIVNNPSLSIGASGGFNVAYGSIAFTVNSTQIAKFYSSLGVGFAGGASLTVSSFNEYSFYSMEYYN